MTTTVDWRALREEFPTLRETAYLNTCSLGLLSNPSRQAVNRYLDLWAGSGAAAWYDHWMAQLTKLRQQFSRLVGCEETEVAIVPNISSGLAAISSSLDFSKRNRVVTTELDFPTVAHHFLAQEGRGVETVIVPSKDRISVDSRALEEAINDKTALVATSRVFFTSGQIQDVAYLADLCHQRGALLLVDDYQGTGQLPIDVKATGIDVLLSGGLKWLLGGPGIAYMYVREELIQSLTPTITGWFAHRDQFDFSPSYMAFKEDARRFEAGTPSVAAVYAGEAGLSLVNQVGPEAIRQRTSELTADLVSRLGEEGFELQIPATPESHASITLLKSSEPHAVVKELSKRSIIVDARSGGVRISPYFYNSTEDNQRLVEALREIAKGSQI